MLLLQQNCAKLNNMNNTNKSKTFVYGSDDFLVDRRARVIYNQLSSGIGEIFLCDHTSKTILDTINKIIDIIITPSLFSEENVIWIRSANFLNGITSDVEKNAIDELFNAIANISDRKIIVSASNVDKRTRIFKTLINVADVIDVDEENKNISLATIIRGFAKENNVTIDDDAIELLQDKCGNHYRALKNEIDKLSAFIWNRKQSISRDDVMLLVDDYASDNFFEPVELFFSGKLSDCTRSIDVYLFGTQEIRPLIAALQSRNRLLIQLKSLIQQKSFNISAHGIRKNDIDHAAQYYHMENFEKSGFNVFSQNPWYLSKLIQEAVKFPLHKLLALQTMLCDGLQMCMNRPNDVSNILKNIALKFAQ